MGQHLQSKKEIFIMKRFSDFAEEYKPLEGDKKKIDDILNQELEITGYKVGKSKYKENDYLTLQFKVNGDFNVLFTGSGVLIDQLRKYEDEIPFMATIKKINKYYTLT